MFVRVLQVNLLWNDVKVNKWLGTKHLVLAAFNITANKPPNPPPPQKNKSKENHQNPLKEEKKQQRF